MQCDFHYCIIKILAVKAGFNADDAEIIAYASQYVDDAVEHKPITIHNFPFQNCESYNYQTEKFDPVCTAHTGFDMITALKKDVQRKIYVCFHFIPHNPINNSDEYFDYRTFPNSNFANIIIDKAIYQFRTDNASKTRNLIKLGIALHSYADTWAHQYFSGIHKSYDNDIEDLEVRFNNKKISNEFWEHFNHILPDIGHAEAGSFPDMTHVDFSCLHEHQHITNKRENYIHFADAARKIYETLIQLTGNINKWSELEPQLIHFFKLEKEGKSCETCNKKKIAESICNGVSFGYNRLQWRTEALAGDNFNWHKLSVEDYDSLEYQYNGDNKWFYFHEEAGKQRKYIFEHIPKE